MKPIILIGAGGHCRSCIDVIEQENKYKILGIIDNDQSLPSSVLGYPVIGGDDDLPLLRDQCDNALITVGQIKNADIRIKIFKQLKKLDYILPVIISPDAYIARDVLIGEGTIVMNRAMVNCCARIGGNCIINSQALVEHDACLGDHCHIATGAIVNGGALIADEVFIGSQSVVVQEAEIAQGYFLQANSRYPV
jgi:sugar O-acyltransferase (sialic acid O-acetyltransferase NeuD family)